MGKTSIEWTDASWNPIVGCTEVSPGCAHCYAARLACTRLRYTESYKGLTTIDREGVEQNAPVHWAGQVRFLPERLDEPTRWKKPKKIFVCDMGDLFHESVTQGMLLEVFTAMAAAPQHTYQLLTKRAERMKTWLQSFAQVERFHPMRDDCRWPWPNVWCGVSVENQRFADERIPHLLATPAAVRFISAEPMLSPLTLVGLLTGDRQQPSSCVNPLVRWNALTGQWWDYTGFEQTQNERNPHGFPRQKLDWVIVGGESGPAARPMHPVWARWLRDQCVAADVPFFFKQWGSWAPTLTKTDGYHLWKMTKKSAGRLLDGREWNEFPRGSV